VAGWLAAAAGVPICHTIIYVERMGWLHYEMCPHPLLHDTQQPMVNVCHRDWSNTGSTRNVLAKV